MLIYSQTDAKRLGNIRRQPRVSLNFDGNGGEDVVVLTGTAEILDDYPPVSDNAAWLAKYDRAIEVRFGSTARFSERFSVLIRIRLSHVRGF